MAAIVKAAPMPNPSGKLLELILKDQIAINKAKKIVVPAKAHEKHFQLTFLTFSIFFPPFFSP